MRQTQMERMISLAVEVGETCEGVGNQVWVRFSGVDWEGLRSDIEWHHMDEDARERKLGEMGYEVTYTCSAFHGTTNWVRLPGKILSVGGEYYVEFDEDGGWLRSYQQGMSMGRIWQNGVRVESEKFHPSWGGGISKARKGTRRAGSGWLVSYVNVMAWLGKKTIGSRIVSEMDEMRSVRDRIEMTYDSIREFRDRLTQIDRVRAERVTRLREAIGAVEDVEGIIDRLVGSGLVVLEEVGYKVEDSVVLGGKVVENEGFLVEMFDRHGQYEWADLS